VEPVQPQSLRIATPGLTFEPNRGQDASPSEYIGRGPGYTVRLETSKATVEFQHRHAASNNRAGLTLSFSGEKERNPVGSEQSPRVVSMTGADPLPGVNSYFPNSDPHSWRPNVPTYSRVNYREILAGVDLAFYGKQDRLEYDFVLRPGADPAPVSFTLTGAENIHLDADGNLAAMVDGEDFKLLKPIAYQASTNTAKQTAVAASYRIDQSAAGEVRVGFTLGDYDHSQPLVIDPVLTYGIYIPGIGTPSAPAFTTALTMTGDAQGNVYEVAQISGNGAAYNVLKFDPNGKLLFNVSLESAAAQVNPSGIAVDAVGNVFVAGSAGNGLLTTTNAYQPSTSALNGDLSAFLTEIKADASTVLYSSYLGGTGVASATGVGTDKSGNVYVTGITVGAGFPATAGAYMTPPPTQDSEESFDFATKLNTSLSGKASLIYSSLIYDSVVTGYLSTSKAAMAVDSSGEVFLATYSGPSDISVTPGSYSFPGREAGEAGAYVIKWNAAGSNLIYTAFLGPGAPAAIALSGSGEGYVTGTVVSADFPTTPGAYQTNYAGGFVSKLSPDGSQLDYSTFLSGPSGYAGTNVNPTSIALLPGCVSSCVAYIGGLTSTGDFPLVNPVQSLAAAVGFSTGFITELNAAGSSPAFSTYLGSLTTGTYGLAVLSLDSLGDIYFASTIGGPDAPVTAADGSSYGAYLAKVSPSAGSLALVTPYPVAFPGSSTVGAIYQIPVNLRNLGSKPLNLVRPFTFSSTDFSESDQCGSALAAGAACQVEISFTPAQSGLVSATMTIHSDAPDSPTVVPLSGTGTDQPALGASAYVLTFSNTLIGASSASQTVTITNFGDTALEIAPVTTTAPDYAIADHCPAQLAAKASCQIGIVFSPINLGLAAEYIFIPEPGGYYYYDGYQYIYFPNGIYVSFNGIGVPASGLTGSAAFSAYAINFGSLLVGTQAASQSVTITNQGTTPLVISSVTATTQVPSGAQDFLVGQLTCNDPDVYCALPLSIAPEESATLGVQFSPSYSGSETGMLNLTDSASGTTQQVYLSGMGYFTPPALAITPANLAFPPQPVGDSSAAQTFYMSNTGDGSITLDRALASGDFEVASPQGSCEGTSLAALGTCSLSVVFTPTATGARNGKLTLIDSLGNPQTFNLTGTGVAATGALTVNESSLTFSAQADGTTSSSEELTITNPGNSPVTVNSIAATGDFNVITAYGSVNCAGVLVPVSSCTLDVFFSPTIATGADTGTLSIKSTAGTQNISLRGTVVQADTALQMTPAKIIFPTVQTSTTAGANGEYQIYLENTGNQPITFAAPPTVTGTAGTPSGDFTINTSDCYEFFLSAYQTPQPFPPGTFCYLTVSFTPSLATAEQAVLSLTDAGGTRPLRSTGPGRRPPPQSQLIPTPPSSHPWRAASLPPAVPDTGISPSPIPGPLRCS
jgi:hypothetical protein